MLILTACSSTKEQTDGLLLQSVKVKTESKDIDASALSVYVKQRPQTKWFVVKKSVPYNPMLTERSVADLTTAMQNMGYMDATVHTDTVVKGRKVALTYHLHPNELFFIRHFNYDIQDDSIAAYLKANNSMLRLKEGMVFSVNELDEERRVVTQGLNNAGYYRFHKDFIKYTADTLSGSNLVDITMHILPYHEESEDTILPHARYKVRRVTFLNREDSVINLRRSVLEENTLIRENDYYCADDLQRTYNNFGRLSAVKYTNINFTELPDSNMLDCNIQISNSKRNTISFQPEGTNTAGDLGAAVTLTYENRNLFRGAETFSMQFRGAYEAITGLEGYQNHDYREYNVEAKLSFPRFVLPFVSAEYRRKSRATSELLVSYNMQNRPEFHRQLLNASWRYLWTDSRNRTSYRFDLIDLNYIHMPWLSETFKADYLDNVSNRNAILRYNYADLFVMKMGFSLTRSWANNALKLNVETAGNLLNGVSHLLRSGLNEHGQYTLFNIAYAQYAKGDLDFTHVERFDSDNELAFHVGFGMAYPYGNSVILPFEKRYFAGGPNSVRGWTVRGLGPGKYTGNEGAIDFINQTGDMKLDLNVEYRTHLFWKLNGALFVDAGNVWTLRQYDAQPGGQFRIAEFYKQLAVAYGMGLRLNFGYFILRFDVGMKAINPAYQTSREHWPIIHPRLKRDAALHFAVGMPF